MRPHMCVFIIKTRRCACVYLHQRERTVARFHHMIIRSVRHDQRPARFIPRKPKTSARDTTQWFTNKTGVLLSSRKKHHGICRGLKQALSLEVCGEIASLSSSQLPNTALYPTSTRVRSNRSIHPSITAPNSLPLPKFSIWSGVYRKGSQIIQEPGNKRITGHPGSLNVPNLTNRTCGIPCEIESFVPDPILLSPASP